MVFTRHHTTRGHRGATLLELLLAAALVLGLSGAVVFCFNSLQRGAQLDEGAMRLESLIRFARAHAANSGKVVRVVFSPESSDDGSPSGTHVRVQVQSDTATSGSTFVEVGQTREDSESVNELVNVVTVELQGAANPAAAGPPAAPSPEESSDSAPGPVAAQITFYPDGSSDSAEIILTSRDTEDSRRVSLKLTGITGATRRLVLTEAESAQSKAE
ncbi:MAG: hypothetical protein FJ386_02310 [Verrucomicrobia bacterium]|nr:hypothetical protein [Verrucomicrobiota bacterium]